MCSGIQWKWKSRWGWGWEWKRNGNGRVGVRVDDDVWRVLPVGEQADERGGRDARKELWGRVAGVGEEGTLSFGPWCILNGFQRQKADAMSDG